MRYPRSRRKPNQLTLPTSESDIATVQDNTRERKIAEAGDLKLSEQRAGTDAYDEFENPFELKSTTKGGVTTARDVGQHTIKIWRNEFWLIAEGINHKDDRGFEILSLYIAHPSDLESWFSQVEQNILAQLAPCQTVIEAARKAGVDPEAIRICENVVARGVTINNPHIPMGVVKKNATQLNLGTPQEVHHQIQQFVKNRPLK
jgi:hypothetical protein